MSRILALLVAAILVTSGVSVAAEFSVTTSPSIDTPDRVQPYQGKSFDITSIARVDPGDNLDVTVDVPPETGYQIGIYRSDQGSKQVKDSKGGTSDGSYTFQIVESVYEPGTYVVGVEDEDGIQAITPLVVSGYFVTVDAPRVEPTGSEMTVDATVTTIDDSKSIDQLQVVIGDDNERKQMPMSSEGNGEYTASVTLDSLPEGDYSLYVIVQGSQTVLGNQELLGVSDPQPFTVEAQSTPTETTTDGPSNGGGAGGENPPGDGSPTPSETTSLPRTSGVANNPGTSSETTGGTDTNSMTTSTTNDDPVITPNEATTAQTTTSPGQSLGLLPPIIALLAAILLALRRR